MQSDLDLHCVPLFNTLEFKNLCRSINGVSLYTFFLLFVMFTGHLVIYMTKI